MGGGSHQSAPCAGSRVGDPPRNARGGQQLAAHRGGAARDSRLDRKVADKRVFPAIDILKSGTRKEELLVDPTDLAKTFVLRRILNPMGTTDAVEFLLGKLKATKSNSEFFDSMNT